MHLSLICCNIKPGDEVITTPLTFCATVNTIIHAGGVPVLVDVDPKTYNIDIELMERSITTKTKAIIPVHFAVRMCEITKIVDIAKSNNLKVIEDCAHAIESELDGIKAGTHADFGCFSFYSTKNIVTGEGGIILSKDQLLLKRIRALSLHGMSKDTWNRFGSDGYKHYQVIECGYKYNMMDLQAAIGCIQIDQTENFWKKRHAVWSAYMDAFNNLNVGLPPPFPANLKHAFHLFTLEIDPQKCGISRDQFIDEMTKLNIGVGVHYLSIPEHPYYQTTFGWKPEDFPNAMRLGRQLVSLPISAKLSYKDIQDVIDTTRYILKKYV